MFVEIAEPSNRRPNDRSTQELAIGIDLGTTYSLAAISERNQPRIITEEYIPSVVSFAQPEATVGHKALKDMEEAPEAVITSVKRRMGHGNQDIQAGDRILTPLEVSAEILKKVKQQVEASLGRSVSKAVITVPAYFEEAARLATKDAARLAGLEVLRLVNEPTAAALAYGLDTGAEGLYAIYDLGGGTFDFSLLRLCKGVFQVLATAGDTHLGGDDFDAALLDHVFHENGIELTVRDHKKALMDIRTIKEKLSSCEVINDTLHQHGLIVERARFEGLIRPFIEKTLTICEQALADAQVSKNELKGIVLVGGSTRIPLVKEMVQGYFNQEPLCTLNPDQVVALGAALQAEALTFGSDTLLLDITPLSLGLETMGGLVDRIIERNSPIPISQSKVFTTYQDGQTGLQLHIVQGEREMANDCRSLARFELSGIPRMPAGTARVRVQFSLDADGLLSVEAREEITGIYQKVEVKPSYGLSEEELLKILQTSFAHAKQDIEDRLLIEARLKAKGVLTVISAALEEDGHLLSRTQSATIFSTMETLEKHLNHRDRGIIEETLATLKGLSQPFIEARLNDSLELIKGRQIEEVEQNLQKR